MEFDGEVRVLQQIPRQDQRNRLIRFDETLLDQLLQSGERYRRGRFAPDPFRADLRACTRARRRVFLAGDADGDAVSVTASFPGLGDGDGSAANTLDSAISPMATDKTKRCLIIYNIWFLVRVGVFLAAEVRPTRSSQT